MIRAVRIAFLIVAVVCGGCNKQSDSVVVEFRIAEEHPADGLTEKVFSGWGQTQPFYIHEEILLEGSDIIRATVVTVSGHPAVEVVFSEKGREIFAQLTDENINKRLGMLVDGKLVCAPLIRSRITVGKAVIDGDFPEERARELAFLLTRQ